MGIKIKKKRVWNIRLHYVLCAILFLIMSVIIYFCSFDSFVHVLDCKGNYYFSDQQIYNFAGVSTKSRMILHPSILLKDKLYEQPLIENVDITKHDGKLSFHIKEKTVIGYYVKENKNYMLTVNKEAIEIKPRYLKIITHFPLLSNLTDKQMKMLCEEFTKHPKQLNRKVIEKIAEIVPYKSSYDKDMLKITMQDGNIVYSSIDDLAMLSNYQTMLTKLKGKSVCLMLDEKHSTIEKVDCDTFSKSKKKKEKEQPEKKELKDQPVEELNEEVETPSEIDPYAQVDDWVVDDFFGYEYSPNLDIYKDPETGIYYQYSEEVMALVPIE